MRDPLAAAAAVSDPLADNDASCLSADPGETVAILAANKIPLLELDTAACPDALRSSAAWRERVDLERRSRSEQHEAFEPVAEALLSAGIPCVLIKSSGSFPYRSSNMDLLVPPIRFAEAARHIEELGHLRLPHYREDHKLLFHRFRAGRSVLSVHLHESVSWGRVMILDGDGCVARSASSKEEAFAILSGEDRVIALLAHSLYETDEIRLSDLRSLRFAVSRGIDWDALTARVCDRGWETGFHAIVSIAAHLEERVYGASCVPAPVKQRSFEAMRAARWAGVYHDRLVRRIASQTVPVLPFPISRIYSKLHYVERLLNESTRAPDERLTDLLATGGNLVANRLGWRSRPAVVISLSGLDGSGKSTVIRALRESMTVCEIPVSVVWNRGGFSRVTGLVKRAGRAVLPIPADSDEVGKDRWLARLLPGALFAWSVLMEQLVLLGFRVTLPRLFGRSVLCDRYVFDTATDLIVKAGPRAPVIAATRLLAGLTRRPDVALLIDVSAEAAAGRKPGDVPMARLARHREVLLDFSSRCGLHRIDGERPVAEVTDDVVDRVLRGAFARFAGDTARASGGEG